MLKLISIIPLKVLVMIIIGLFINGKIVLAQESHQFNRSILLEKNIVLPNNAVNTKVIRVVFPPAFKTPWHVVKGSLKVIEGGKANTYSSGDVFWESGDLMSVENINETPAELIIFELVPAK